MTSIYYIANDSRLNFKSSITFSKIEKLKDSKNYFMTKIKIKTLLKTPEKVFHVYQEEDFQ